MFSSIYFNFAFRLSKAFIIKQLILLLIYNAYRFKGFKPLQNYKQINLDQKKHDVKKSFFTTHNSRVWIGCKSEGTKLFVLPPLDNCE